MRDLDLEAFAHIIAHDLGAPIRGISIHLKLLERQVGSDPEVTERIELLQDRLQRLDAMVQNVREFSKAIVLAQDPEATDVADAARSAWDRLAPDATLDLGGRATVAANRLAADMMIGELLRNAVDHHDGTAKVRMMVRDGDQVEIVVEDDGPGLPAEPERMMEPFTKAGANVDAGRGTGLALAALMARHLGGSLELASGIHDGRGVRATLRLPRA